MEAGSAATVAEKLKMGHRKKMRSVGSTERRWGTGGGVEPESTSPGMF